MKYTYLLMVRLLADLNNVVWRPNDKQRGSEVPESIHPSILTYNIYIYYIHTMINDYMIQGKL